MKRFVLVAAIAYSSYAQNAPTKPVTLMSGIGTLHHPVSTRNAEAQQFFDQGLRFVFAFNHDEAARSGAGVLPRARVSRDARA